MNLVVRKILLIGCIWWQMVLKIKPVLHLSSLRPIILYLLAYFLLGLLLLFHKLIQLFSIDLGILESFSYLFILLFDLLFLRSEVLGLIFQSFKVFLRLFLSLDAPVDVKLELLLLRLQIIYTVLAVFYHVCYVIVITLLFSAQKLLELVLRIP